MNLTEILVDPLDQSPLEFSHHADGRLEGVASAHSTYRITNGQLDLTPDPLPTVLRERQELWDKLQDNGNFTYVADPTLNLSTDDDFANVFQKTTGIHGKVLDVGCGPQAHSPRYLDGPGIGPVIGLDPLEGAGEREFPFLMGISEALPFTDISFDGVVFCRSLDHVLDTATALQEAMRVLRKDGRLCVVLDLMPQERQGFLAKLKHFAFRGGRQVFLSARANGIVHAIRYLWTVATLKVPEGAEDMFHMHFPSTDEVRKILDAAGASDIQFHDLSEDETICVAIKS